VAITIAAWNETVAAGGKWEQDQLTAEETLKLQGGQSIIARIWDVLNVLRFSIKADSDRVHFKVDVDVAGDGNRTTVELWALCGPGDDAEPVVTVMLQGED
jgi:hypothetical protein